MRVDPLINLAHDYQEAAAALQRELRRIDIDELPDTVRRGMAELMRRGAHNGVTVAHVLQPRAARRA